MHCGRGLVITVIVCAAYASRAYGQAAAPVADPPTAADAPPEEVNKAPSMDPATPPEAPVAVPLPPPPADALALAKQGRRLLKDKDLAAAVAKLKEAVEKGQSEKLDPEIQAGLHYIYGLALLRADKDAEGLQQLQRAVSLSPKDTEVRVALASQYLDLDKPALAREQAELALKIGITDKDDLSAAHKVVKDAKSQLLHSRLTVNAMVSWAFDSNVLQGGPIIQIANKSTSKKQASHNLATLIHNKIAPAMLRANLKTFLVNTYVAPSPSMQEWDLPINIDLPIDGRLFSQSGVALWLGYRFQQTLMVSPAGFDHDDYSLQEHDLPLRLEYTPTKWLFLRAKAEGFVNFSGLRQFSPYQGGLNAGLETWFIESPRWKTRLLYQHQLRRSFDQLNSGYLNGDRDEVKLIQELRLRGHKVRARGSLSGRFRSDRTGVFSTTQDYDLSTNLQVAANGNPTCDGPAGGPPVLSNEARLGCYSYNAPLSYNSVEVATRWLLSVPGGVDLSTNLSYEHFYYPALYTASFTPTLLPTDNADPGTWLAAAASTPPVAMPSARRIDNLFSVYIGATNRLPHDFSLELSYTYYRNLSTIANYLDNRNYEKHVVLLAGYYMF